MVSKRAGGFLFLWASTTPISSNLSIDPLLIGKTAPDAANASGNAPKAYLTVLFFDERFKFVEEGSSTIRVSQADAANAILPLANLKAPKNGYVYIYVSNESSEYVYFDNLQVGHTRGRIIEEDHYTAFGLKIAGISSRKLGDVLYEGHLDNKNLYNDKELIDEADLNWYDYGYRNYDPQTGRFPQLDPLTDDYPFYTPYQYAGNEPIANVDLDGLEPLPMVTVTTYVSKASSQAGKIAGATLTNLIKVAPNVISYTGLDGVNTGMSKPRPVFNNTPAPPPSSYLSPAPNRTAYEQARVTQKVKQSNLAAGLKEDGSETFLGKLASNKTFTRAADNLILPTLEVASYLGGAGEVVQGLKIMKAANVVKKVAVHGNSLKSLKPTWGYKLYSNDGTFLKNGITNKLIPESRYTRSFMFDKKMGEKMLFPNRQAAYDWEFQQNLIQRGPLNLNMH